MKLDHSAFSWTKRVLLTCVICVMQMEKAPWGKDPIKWMHEKANNSKVESQPKARKIGVNITSDARKGPLSKEG